MTPLSVPAALPVERGVAYGVAQALQSRGDPEAARAMAQLRGLILDKPSAPTVALAGELLRSEAALQALSWVACRGAQLQVRRAAAAALERVAALNGIAPAQLEDRLPSACGLGVGATFDYGPRRFEPALGDRCRPLLRGEHRRMHTALPRPRRGDDPELVARCAYEWPAHRRRLSWTARLQAARLERAMVEGRRWPADDFRRDILGHPLMRELARHVIWAGYGDGGELGEAFCLADVDHGGPVGEDYRGVDIARYPSVGIPHPADVGPARRVRWGELLSDFHTEALFPQAARPVHAPDPGDLEAGRLTRHEGLRLRSTGPGGWLGGRGWEIGAEEAPRGSRTQVAVRSFDGLGIAAAVRIEVAVYDEQLGPCVFLSTAPGRESEPVPLARVPAAAVSEVLWQLGEMAAAEQLRP